MVTVLKHSVRDANIGDQQQLANLIHFETLVHRHLDWRPPLEWIGYDPYLVLEKENRLVATLACPPDPPSVAWLRLFAVADKINLAEAWSLLWTQCLETLMNIPGVQIAAIPLQSWFQRLLQISGFQSNTNVVMMVWDNGSIPPPTSITGISIRPMNIDDLSIVESLDESAFGSLWHNSRGSLEYAYRQAAFATIAENEGAIVGYQISTSMQMGGHLARLATHPDFQRRGIGSLLVRDLLMQFKQRGALRITVNTQEDNYASVALYERAGFTRTGETYPVFQYLPK
jgi:ribosomal protein S18 acetylase RimI-like enzyme